MVLHHLGGSRLVFSFDLELFEDLPISVAFRPKAEIDCAGSSADTLEPRVFRDSWPCLSEVDAREGSLFTLDCSVEAYHVSEKQQISLIHRVIAKKRHYLVYVRLAKIPLEHLHSVLRGL